MFFIVSAVVIGVFAFFFAFGYYTFCHACLRRKKYPADKHAYGGGSPIPEQAISIFDESREWFDSSAFERVAVTSDDGITLVGYALEAETDAKGTVIFFHGYHSSCRRDLSVQAFRLYSAGYNVILTCQRAHGESEGRYICFGAKERFDVAVWSHFAEKRFPNTRIALFGLSMGASSVLMACNTILSENVRCIIADCGFNDPWGIIKRRLLRKHKILPFPTIYFMNFWSKRLADFDYREISTLDTLRENKYPILLIHGSADTYVPPLMSELAQKTDVYNCELMIVQNAPHSQSVYFDTEGYMKKVLSLLEKNL